ncbi:aldehyde dehydrogenase family protein [Nocardioides sp. NBC_00368]|uniref:aldehyde dehydrogenase family protein n=1 Tax=Nocardioides sp. NBC_00368 TaxID=2976000 RepID=UPI002E1A7252
MTDRVLLSIGGQHMEAALGHTFERRNPVTGEVVTVAAAGSVDDAVAGVDAAAAAFPAWSSTSPAVRLGPPLEVEQLHVHHGSELEDLDLVPVGRG